MGDVVSKKTDGRIKTWEFFEGADFPRLETNRTSRFFGRGESSFSEKKDSTKILQTSFFIGSAEAPSFVAHAILKKNKKYWVIPIFGRTRRQIEEIIDGFEKTCGHTLKTPFYYAVSMPKPYDETRLRTFLALGRSHKRERVAGTTIETNVQDRVLAICSLFDKIIF